MRACAAPADQPVEVAICGHLDIAEHAGAPCIAPGDVPHEIQDIATRNRDGTCRGFGCRFGRNGLARCWEGPSGGQQKREPCKSRHCYKLHELPPTTSVPPIIGLELCPSAEQVSKTCR